MSELDMETISLPNGITPDKKEAKNNKMREALFSIAQELLILQDSSNTTSNPNTTNIEDIYDKLIESKSSLAFKSKLIKRLKKNVKTACTVAQAAISAGENESTSLNGHLHLARNEYADLYQKHRQTSQIIQNMTKENKELRDKLENIFNVISLGYSELQKTNSDYFTETSAKEQLKHILACCGRFYADLNNERDKNVQLNQKNRFLNNKMSILNNTIDGITEDLKNLRCHNSRLQNENTFLKKRKENLQPKYIAPISLVCNRKCQNNFANAMKMKKYIRKAPEIDVTIHLSIVKKLLRDQDELLRDLKSLSNLIRIEQTPEVQSPYN